MPKQADVFDLYVKTLAQLELALATPPTEPRDLAGIIKSFEFTFELGWKAIQARAISEGRSVNSPRAAFAEAFNLGWTQDPKVWAAILEDTNRTVHTYNEEIAKEMIARIRLYVQPFRAL